MYSKGFQNVFKRISKGFNYVLNWSFQMLKKAFNCFCFKSCSMKSHLLIILILLTCIISSWGSHPDLRPGERLLALWCRGLQLQQLHSEVSPSLLWWSRCSEEIIFQFQLIIRLHEDPAGSYGFPDTYCNHFMTRWSKTAKYLSFYINHYSVSIW